MQKEKSNLYIIYTSIYRDILLQNSEDLGDDDIDDIDEADGWPLMMMMKTIMMMIIITMTMAIIDYINEVHIWIVEQSIKFRKRHRNNQNYYIWN